MREKLKKHQWPVGGALLATIYLLYGIFTATNSTASIGFLFIPVFAGLGALYGLAGEHVAALLRGKQKAGLKTAFVLFLLGFTASKVYQNHLREQKLARAEDPATPVPELLELKNAGDRDVLQRIAGNPSLPDKDLQELISENLTDYGILAGAALNPKLSAAQMEAMVRMSDDRLPSDVEYRLYQTYVWAALARRKDFPSHLVHELASKPNPQHFLILALLEKPELSCEQKRAFLPQENPVLESSITHALKSCN